MIFDLEITLSLDIKEQTSQHQINISYGYTRLELGKMERKHPVIELGQIYNYYIYMISLWEKQSELPTQKAF